MLYVVDMYEKKEKHQDKREKRIPTMKLSLHPFSSAKHSHNVVLVPALSLKPELNSVSEVSFRGE
jgi:hypothetical protein